jgi:hypothetical protein
MRRSTRRLGSAFEGLSPRLPAAETMGGWGLALLLVSWLLTLPIVNHIFPPIVQQIVLILGVLFLTLALVTSLLRGRGGRNKTWRGERVSYGSPYGESFLNRLRRMFRGR